MKQEFLNFLNALMEACPDIVRELKTENVEAYIQTLTEEENDKPEITENGLIVLNFLKGHSDVRTWRSRDIAEQMGISSRGVSGTLRKLTNDGFVEKIGKDPCIYTLTEKGKNYKEVID